MVREDALDAGTSTTPAQLERQASLSQEDMDVETCWRGKEGQWKAWKGRPRGLDCYSKEDGSHCRPCAELYC